MFAAGSVVGEPTSLTRVGADGLGMVSSRFHPVPVFPDGNRRWFPYGYSRDDRTRIALALYSYGPRDLEPREINQLCRLARRARLSATEYQWWAKFGYWDLRSEPVQEEVSGLRSAAGSMAFRFLEAGLSPHQACELIANEGLGAALESAEVIAVLRGEPAYPQPRFSSYEIGLLP